MLFYKTVYPETLELLSALMKENPLKDFYLVGGTALSLQIGHRISVDLDLFTNKKFDTEKLNNGLKKRYKTRVISNAENSLTVYINKIKVDFIRHAYPLINPIRVISGIRLVSVQDIAAMKVAVITSRGAKKDFYDLFFLLKKYPLTDVMSWYREKYTDSTELIAVKSLTYFNDAQREPDPILLKSVSWKQVTRLLEKKVREYSRF